jgi:hypothetical protein
MKAIIQATTDLESNQTTYAVIIGCQMFRLSYEYDSTDDDTGISNSMWYPEQLKIALCNAGCKEVEIISNTLSE